MKMPFEKSKKQSKHMRTSKTGKVFSAGSGVRIPDEENSEFLFSITSNKLLLDIVSGKIDPKELAKKELKGRKIIV